MQYYLKIIHADIDFFLSCTFTQRSILLNCSSVGSESEASCCAAGTPHPSLSRLK